MYAALPFPEIVFYIAAWSFAILFGGYKLYSETDQFNPRSGSDYEIGVLTLSGDRYGLEPEWLIWIPFLLFKTPWLVSHFVGAELIRKNNIELLPVWYILISSIFLLNFVGGLTTGFIFIMLSIIYTCKLLKSKILLWTVGAVILLAFTGRYDVLGMLLPIERQSLYLINVACCWSLLRSISYCLDSFSPSPTSPPSSSTSSSSSTAVFASSADSSHSGDTTPASNTEMKQLQQPVAVDYVLYLSYCLYLPTFVFGPLIIYSDFHPGLKQPYKKWTLMRIVYAICSFLRYVFWAFIVDLSLHYMYFHILVIYPKIARALGNWALYGYAYSLGCYFMMKYVVVYGVSSTIARLEQVNAPPHPKCVARIHLYSNMWRHFDKGLYKFIFKYIYLPCCSKESNYMEKLFASFMCFVFVYVWHATYMSVFIWTVLNFLGVTIEGIGKHIGRNPSYRQWEDSILTPRGIRRFHAVLSTPVFLVSTLSSMYFVGSYEIGNVFLGRLLQDSLKHNLYLLFFCYCGCQVSIEVADWEERQMLREKQKSQ